MAKRVKSVSMPGLAQALYVADGDHLWSIERTVTYARSIVRNLVRIHANVTVNGKPWSGVVAAANLDDEGLLDGYTIMQDVPYPVGRVLDMAWESLT